MVPQPAVSSRRALCILLPLLATFDNLQTSHKSPRTWCWLFALSADRKSSAGHPSTVNQHNFGFSHSLTVHWPKHIYQFQFYCSISEGADIADVKILSGTPTDHPVVASSRAYPQVQGIPKYFYLLQLQGLPQWQLVNQQKPNSEY